MDDLVFHLEKYLNKFHIQPSNLMLFGENISSDGVMIRHSLNYDVNKEPVMEVLTSIPGENPFIFRIQKKGVYCQKEIMPDYSAGEDGISDEKWMDSSGKGVQVWWSKLRINNLANEGNYKESILETKKKSFDKYIFISDGVLFSPSFVSPFKVYENTFICLQQYFYYHKSIAQKQYELARLILNEWSNLDIPKTEIILKNTSLQSWFENSYHIIYKGICSKFMQDPMASDALITTRKGVFIYTSPGDLFLGTGFTEEDSIDDFLSGWKGNNLYGYCLSLVRDDILNIK